MADKVTLSLDPDTLGRARTAADAAGLTLSAWMARAARHEALRDAGRRYQEWIEAHPSVRDEVAAFSAFAAANRGPAERDRQTAPDSPRGRRCGLDAS